MPVFTRDDAKEAISLALPTINKVLKSKWSRRKDYHLIIARRLEGGGYEILATKSFGKSDEWESPYDKVAEAKLELTARTGLSSREVQLMHPELLEDDDTIYWGSVICGNIMVSGSGIQGFGDHGINTVVLALSLMQVDRKVADRQEVARATRGAYRYTN